MVLNINNKKIWIAWNYCFLSSWPGTCLYLYLFDRLSVWYRNLFYLSDLQYYLSSTYSLSWPIICLVPVLECLVLVVPSWPFTCMVHVLPIWPGVCLVLVVPSWPGVCLVLVVPSWPGVCLVLVLLSWPGVCLVPLLTGTCCTFLTWCQSGTGTYLLYLPDLVLLYLSNLVSVCYLLYLPDLVYVWYLLVLPSWPGVCLLPYRTCSTFRTWWVSGTCCTFLSWCLSGTGTCCTFLTWCLSGTVLVVTSRPGVCLVLVVPSWPGVCLVPGTCSTFLNCYLPVWYLAYLLTICIRWVERSHLLITYRYLFPLLNLEKVFFRS